MLLHGPVLSGPYICIRRRCSVEKLFAVLNTAGNIVARGPAECAPDASLIKGGQYRLKFFEGEKGRADLEAIIEKQCRKVEKS